MSRIIPANNNFNINAILMGHFYWSSLGDIPVSALPAPPASLTGRIRIPSDDIGANDALHIPAAREKRPAVRVHKLAAYTLRFSNPASPSVGRDLIQLPQTTKFHVRKFLQQANAGRMPAVNFFVSSLKNI